MNVNVIVVALLLLHTLEEMFYSFWDTDYLSQTIANALHVQPITVYFIGQVVLYVLVVFIFLKRSTQARLLEVVLGLVLLFEVTHVVSAVGLHAYTPGLFTGVLLFVVGIFYWAKLLKNKKTL